MTEAEISQLLSTLSTRPDNVEDRFKLIGYYNQKLYRDNKADDVLIQQLQWLMQKLPDLRVMSGVFIGYEAADRDQHFSLYKTLLDTLEKHEHNEQLLVNALVFLRSPERDRELLLRLQNELETLYPGRYDWE
ncbi:MAG: hypothetical protein U0105_09690 [Candidatus Obscuribacterales bacterium]